MSKISVIVPIYNKKKYLKRCIESIIHSTLKEIEVILIDDGSTDGSWNLIQQYKEMDSRIIAVHTENRGLSAARNEGLAIATAEYITFVDADDYIAYDIYEKLYEIGHRFSPDIIDYEHTIEFPTGEKYPAKQSSIEKDRLLNRDYLEEYIIPVMLNVDSRKEFFIQNYVCMKLFKHSLIKKYEIWFDPKRRTWEDKFFVVDCLEHADTYYSSGVYGYYYVMNEGSLSRTFNPLVFDMILESIVHYKEQFKGKYNFDKEYTINYYSHQLCTQAITMLSYLDTNDSEIKNAFGKLAVSEEAKKLMEKWKPDSAFERKFKQCIMDSKGDFLYMLCKKEWRSRENKKNANVWLGRLKRIAGRGLDVLKGRG